MSLTGYVLGIQKCIPEYEAEVKALLMQKNKEKAQIVMTKKKLVEKEVSAKHTVHSYSTASVCMQWHMPYE